MTPEQRAQMEKQVEQLTCFLDSTYAGLARDVKITWEYSDGPDAIGRTSRMQIADYYRDTHGKHTEITIGVGDSYYGSTTLSHMLYEHAYHMRERLLDKLNEKALHREYADLAARW
jgi:hypothetical protein